MVLESSPRGAPLLAPKLLPARGGTKRTASGQLCGLQWTLLPDPLRASALPGSSDLCLTSFLGQPVPSVAYGSPVSLNV